MQLSRSGDPFPTRDASRGLVRGRSIPFLAGWDKGAIPGGKALGVDTVVDLRHRLVALG